MLYVKPFVSAYDDYEKAIAAIPKDAFVLEVGVGAFPSIVNGENYYCLDPDSSELEKVKCKNKIFSSVEDYETTIRFDFIVSQMVLEHVENPTVFHEKVFRLLKPTGLAIHFFACGKSIPSRINSFLPERISDFILRKTRSRDIDKEPKYKAFYLWTNIFQEAIVNRYVEVGYIIKSQAIYIGHNYLHAVPVFKVLENMFSKLTYKLRWKSSASVALLILNKAVPQSE